MASTIIATERSTRGAQARQAQRALEVQEGRRARAERLEPVAPQGRVARRALRPKATVKPARSTLTAPESSAFHGLNSAKRDREVSVRSHVARRARVVTLPTAPCVIQRPRARGCVCSGATLVAARWEPRLRVRAAAPHKIVDRAGATVGSATMCAARTMGAHRPSRPSASWSRIRWGGFRRTTRSFVDLRLARARF